MALTVAAGWASCLLTVLLVFSLSRILHGIILEARPVETLRIEFTALVLAFLLRAALAWVREMSGFRAGARVRDAVRRQLLDSLTARGPAFAREEQTGAMTTVFMEQVEALNDFYALFLPQLALAVLVPLSVAAAVFPVSWTAGALLLAAGPLIPLFTVLVGMGAESISQRHFQSLGRLSAHFLDVLQGLPTLKLFGRSREEAQRIGEFSAQYRLHTMKVLRVAFLSSAVLEFFASLSIAIVAIYLGMSYLGYLNFGTYGKELSLADGLFILLLAPEYFQPLRELGAHYHARAQALAAAWKIQTILEAPAPGPVWGGSAPAFTEGIQIRCLNVHFAHDTERSPALTGLDLEVKPGTFAVIVGSSGAGKSTLLNLLLGFIRPRDGEIRINDLPLQSLDPAHWRSRVGWIGQNPVLFQGTIYSNIHLGRPEAGEAEVVQAARAAGVLHFARELPQGLHTKLAEQGVGLSRGQVQRVALARVFLKNPPLLLLDEPTAGLDVQTEAFVTDALEALRPGRTVVMVTHRLAHIGRADRIHVMQAGKIVQEGDHESLMAADGPFRRLALPLALETQHG